MATIRAFRALRPPRELAGRVLAPPYDVVDTAEAMALADGNPDSFLRISRPEVGLEPGADADAVHRFGRAMLEDFVRRGVLVRDTVPVLLVYRQQLGQAVQTGVVGCASVEEYRNGVIATHEHTRPDKETDRTRHIEALGAHDEPVFLMYRPDAPGAAGLAAVVERVTSDAPEHDLTSGGVRHTLWTVQDPEAVRAVETAAAAIPTLYVSDGHHRSAAAARLADASGAAGAAEFPVVVFPADELTVMAYHRAVRDLGAHTAASFLAALGAAFDVRPSPSAPDLARHRFGVYLAGRWWLLTARAGVVDEADPIGRLDVSVLQEQVLAPLLGIGDPRTDQRIAFVGGIRGTAELVRLVDAGEFAVAFAVHPTSTAEVMDVADLGEVMPPKSTWFEPKLASGLFVHQVD